MDQLLFRRAVGHRQQQFSLAGAIHFHLGVAVDIAIGMTGDRDRLAPAGDKGLDAVNQDRSAENRTVENGADRAVRAFPHLLELVFFHALGIGGDCGTFDSNTELERAIG